MSLATQQTQPKMRPENAEMKELAARICHDYLNGAWKHVTPQNIVFEHVSGGLSNFLYHISLPEHLASGQQKNENEPSQVLIRVYGQTHGERRLEAIITESVIFTLLSERGLGPKLYGVFPGGRIEQYINAKPLLTGQLADEKLSVQIAQKMAAIHSMEVPLHKEPGWLWDTIERWLKSCRKFLAGQIPKHARLLTKINLNEELVWLRQRLEEEKSPVVFCHNDMQEGNILICQDENDNNQGEATRLVLIDFEYCSYNYRSFDIANHFIEWTYDYTSTEYPFFAENTASYPTEQQKLRFIRTYLAETGSEENPKKLLREVLAFTLASHFFWTLWSMVNAETSKIPFGYLEYAVSRLNAYFRVKKELAPPPAVKRKVSERD